MSFLAFVVAVAALGVALKALSETRPRPGQPTPAERIAGLEERVRDLLYRVWTLEQQGARGAAPRQPEPAAAPAPEAPVPTAHESLPSPAWTAAAEAVHGAAVHAAAPAPAQPASTPATRVDLEQRIGARWTTWVGVVAILFAAA